MQVQMGGPSKAFYAGVAAGSKTTADSAKAMTDQPLQARVAYYWLAIGAALAEYEDKGDEITEAFVAGATTRAPQHTGVLVVEINTSNAAFCDADGDEDDDAQRGECARLLREVASSLNHGYDQGPIRDGNGNLVGRFDIHA